VNPQGSTGEAVDSLWTLDQGLETPQDPDSGSTLDPQPECPSKLLIEKK
jgi:hypothetical protein